MKNIRCPRGYTFNQVSQQCDPTPKVRGKEVGPKGYGTGGGTHGNTPDRAALEAWDRLSQDPSVEWLAWGDCVGGGGTGQGGSCNATCGGIVLYSSCNVCTEWVSYDQDCMFGTACGWWEFCGCTGTAICGGGHTKIGTGGNGINPTY